MESSETTLNQGNVTKPSVLSNAIKYGLYTAAAYILFSLLTWSLDLMNWWVSILGYVVIIAGIILGIINLRDKLNRGFISFGKAFQTGLIISILIAIVSVIYSWILITYIDPGLAERIIQMTEESLIKRGLSDEMIEQQSEITRRMMTGDLRMVGQIVTFFTTVAIGAVVSLICAAILKRNDDSFNSAFNEVR